MQFSSVSSHFCRPKNVIKVGSLFLSDFSAVAHEKLADKFHCVQRKEKYIVSDPIFYGKSIQEQHKLVMDQLPEKIKDEIDFETLAYRVDNMVRHVKLREDVTFNLNIEPATPQMYLDAGVTYFRMEDNAMSSMSAWRSADLQLRNFLSMYHLRAPNNDHALKNRIVLFLRQNCCNDIELNSELANAWASVQLACYYAYGDLLSMENIWDSLTSAEYFCNFLHLIYEQKYFNAYAFLKWLRKEKHFLKMLIVKYDKENPNSQAKKLFCLKEILWMNEEDLIKFIEEIYGKFNKEDGADMEILNFQLNEAIEMMNLIKEKRG
jgi:hypothetical protein